MTTKVSNNREQKNLFLLWPMIILLNNLNNTHSKFYHLWSVFDNHLHTQSYFIWFICLFVSWHINLLGLLNDKFILQEEQKWYYLTHRWEDNGVHTFPNSICPKVNVIAWLEFELTYYDSTVQHFNHYATGTPPWRYEAVHTFSKGICPKGNVIVWLEFELTYYDFAVQHFNHFTMKTIAPLYSSGK